MTLSTIGCSPIRLWACGAHRRARDEHLQDALTCTAQHGCRCLLAACRQCYSRALDQCQDSTLRATILTNRAAVLLKQNKVPLAYCCSCVLACMCRKAQLAEVEIYKFSHWLHTGRTGGVRLVNASFIFRVARRSRRTRYSHTFCEISTVPYVSDHQHWTK